MRTSASTTFQINFQFIFKKKTSLVANIFFSHENKKYEQGQFKKNREKNDKKNTKENVEKIAKKTY